MLRCAVVLNIYVVATGIPLSSVAPKVEVIEHFLVHATTVALCKVRRGLCIRHDIRSLRLTVVFTHLVMLCSTAVSKALCLITPPVLSSK